MTDLASLVQIEDPEFYISDPFPVLARLRSEAPVFYYEPLDTWVLSKYEDVRYASRTPGIFSSTGGIVLSEAKYGSGVMESFFPADAALISTTDPPLHRAVRRTITPPFVPSAVRQLKDEVRACVTALLDRIEPGQPFDWLEQVAVPFPLQVICLLLGVPLDRIDDMREWSDEMLKFGSPASREELAESAAKMATMGEFFTEQFARKRKEPAGDLLSSLLTAELNGEELSAANLQTLATGVLVAGNETMRNLLAGMMWAFTTQPDQLSLLSADRSLIPNAADEFLRWLCPITGFVRTVTEDTELRGQQLKQGQRVYMLYLAANRDEEAFPGGDTLDVRRKPDPMHLALGWGDHVCLGAHLTRMETSVLLEELLDRFSRAEQAGEPRRLASVLQTAWTEVPVRLS